VVNSAATVHLAGVGSNQGPSHDAGTGGPWHCMVHYVSGIHFLAFCWARYRARASHLALIWPFPSIPREHGGFHGHMGW
jgi:hypothetical protein